MSIRNCFWTFSRIFFLFYLNQLSSCLFSDLDAELFCFFAGDGLVKDMQSNAAFSVCSLTVAGSAKSFTATCDSACLLFHLKEVLFTCWTVNGSINYTNMPSSLPPIEAKDNEAKVYGETSYFPRVRSRKTCSISLSFNCCLFLYVLTIFEPESWSRVSHPPSSMMRLEWNKFVFSFPWDEKLVRANLGWTREERREKRFCKTALVTDSLCFCARNWVSNISWNSKFFVGFAFLIACAHTLSCIWFR